MKTFSVDFALQNFFIDLKCYGILRGYFPITIIDGWKKCQLIRNQGQRQVIEIK